MQAGQPVMLVGEGKRKHSFVSAGDVAQFAVAAVNNENAKNSQIVIGGPEPLSWRDVVAAYERATGRNIPVQSVQPGEPLPGLPPTITGLMTSLDMFDSPMDMTETCAVYNVNLTPLEEFVRRQTAGTTA